MIEALFVVAVFCACLGAFRRGEDGCVAFNVTALALLASAALTSILLWLEVPFDAGFWLAIDIAVIGAIAANAIWRRRLPVADWAVIALFTPSWYFYAFPGPLGPDVSTLAVSAQLLLTVPPRPIKTAATSLFARWKANFQHRDEWTDLRSRGADA